MKLALDLKGLQTIATPSLPAGTPIGTIITTLIPYIIGAAGIILLLVLMVGGIELMTSGGDPKRAASARGRITNALVGIMIIFLAYWLVQIVGLILDLEGIGDVFK